MRLKPGKAYHYKYEGHDTTLAYVYCKDIINESYVLHAYVYDGDPAKPYDNGAEYRNTIESSFVDPSMEIKEVPIELWSLCVMKGEYHV